MDGMLGNIIEKVVEKAGGGGGGGHSYEEQPRYAERGYGQPAPPEGLPYPWVARWDERDQRWFYVNERTGERSWERPYGGAPAYRERVYEEAEPRPRYGYEGRYEEQRPERRDHSMMYGAAGAAAGLVGGALLMHEGEKIHEHWDEDKERIEEKVEDFPEDAARWTGERVGEVEEIPYKIENKWDNAVDDVERLPEEAAEWTGRRVGEVERFDDNIASAYDEGRAEGRDDW